MAATQIIFRQTRHNLSIDRELVFHIYREENQVANSLASVGWDMRHYQEYGPIVVSRRL